MPSERLCTFTRAQLLYSAPEVLRLQIQRDMVKSPKDVNLTDAYLRRITEHLDVGKTFEYLLATGNLSSRSGLDLSQATGFTVVAEKLNFFRYISHFRSVHRGAYFTQMRTTTVRKLLPESFGFMCPVHTPDGTPCGLLNHLAARCNIVATPSPPESITRLRRLLLSLGLMLSGEALPPRLPDYVCVHIDGVVVGHLQGARAPAVVRKLRKVKAAALAESTGVGFPRPGVPFHLEVRLSVMLIFLCDLCVIKAPARGTQKSLLGCRLAT